MPALSKGFVLQVKTEKNLAVLRSAPGKLAGLLAAHRADIKRITNDKRYRDDYRQILLDQAKAEFKSKFNQYKNDHAAAASQLAETLKEAKNEPVDTQHAIFNLLQSQANWQRARTLLDAGFTHLEVVEQNKSNLSMLQTLRVELPAYLASTKKSFSTDEKSSGYKTLIDLYEYDLLEPEQQQVRDLEAELTIGSQNLDLTTKHIQVEVEGKIINPPTLLWGWEKGTSIPVAVAASEAEHE